MEDSDESYIFLGTELEPYEEDEPKKKLVSPAQTEVRDSKGRQRFHGAFTGGFSAGYFNTVGSKEGFVPSSFSSSRKEKTECSSRVPEDYMDDEDFGEHGLNPKGFITTDNFTSDHQRQVRRKTAEALTRGSLISNEDSLVDLILPERLTIGVKILRFMGWKEGQGIGPRVKRKRKSKIKPSVKIYGCALPELSDENDVPEFVENIKFAPKDVCPVSFEVKADLHGIGYRGLDPQLALPSTHINLFSSYHKQSSKDKMKGQAFGVGVLEDDDDEIYTVDSMSNYDITMGEQEDENLFGWTAPGRKKQNQHGKPLEYVGKVLQGFTLSTLPLGKIKISPPPPVPRHFKPYHKFPNRSSHAGREMKHNVITRALALGEKPAITHAPVDKAQSRHQLKERKESRFSSVIDPLTHPADNIAQDMGLECYPLKFAGTAIFKPFLKDEKKQERYDKYLALLRENRKDAYEQVASTFSHLTEWEQEQEKEEFLKASKFYRPLQGIMASRFTSAKFEDSKASLAPEEPLKDDTVKATEMKMYGKLTHSTLEWHPDRVLCKRFNVPDPYPGSSFIGVPGLKHDKNFSYLLTEQSITGTQSTLPLTEYSQSSLAESSKERIPDSSSHSQDVGKDPEQHKSIFTSFFQKQEEGEKSKKEEVNTLQAKVDSDVEDNNQPAEDLFRAIFKNTDSEDTSSSSDSSDENASPNKSQEDRLITEVAQSNGSRIHAEKDEGGSDIGNSNKNKDDHFSTDDEAENRTYTEKNQSSKQSFSNKDVYLPTHGQTVTHRKRKHKHENKDKHKKKKRKKEKDKKYHKTERKKKSHHRHKYD